MPRSGPRACHAVMDRTCNVVFRKARGARTGWREETDANHRNNWRGAACARGKASSVWTGAIWACIKDRWGRFAGPTAADDRERRRRSQRAFASSSRAGPALWMRSMMIEATERIAELGITHASGINLYLTPVTADGTTLTPLCGRPARHADHYRAVSQRRRGTRALNYVATRRKQRGRPATTCSLV